jgi:hypothetical protein
MAFQAPQEERKKSHPADEEAGKGKVSVKNPQITALHETYLT